MLCYEQIKMVTAFRTWRRKRFYQGNLQLIDLNSLYLISSALLATPFNGQVTIFSSG